MAWIDWLILPAIGALGGFMAGLLGVGGGIIFVPVLTWYFERMGIPGEEVVKYTLANSILLVFVSGISGIYRQKKLGTYDWKRAVRIGLPGAFAAIIWSYLIQTGNWYRKEDFLLVFLAFLILSIANMIFVGKEYEPDPATTGNRVKERISGPGVGVLAGSVVSLSGLGGGVIMVPLFRMAMKMPMKSATALSLSIIPILSLAPLLNYMITTPPHPPNSAHTGYIVWMVTLPMAFGVAVFASFGQKVARVVPVLWLRIIFALLSGIILIKTIFDLYFS